MPATELQKELAVLASVETIRRKLRDKNFKACSPRKVPLLYGKHIAKRLSLAKAHVNLYKEKWGSVPGFMFAGYLIVNTSPSSQQKLSNMVAVILWYVTVFHVKA